MAWISVHESIDGPKLRNLYKRLGCSKFEATGILNFLWFWGLENADETGRIENADEEDIERYLYGVGNGCRISAKTIVDALIGTEWIDKEEDALYIHDWESWQKEWYKYKKRLKDDAERQRKRRATKKENLPEKPKDNPEDGHVDNPSDNKADEAEPIMMKEPIPVKKPKKTTYSSEFEEFWQIYPRKIEKANANRCYKARLNDGWSPDEMKLAAERYAAECRKNHTEQQYIKHASTFLSANTPFADFLNGIVEEKKPEESLPDMTNPFG